MRFVKWIGLKTCEIHTKEFTNHEDYFEFVGKILFPLELQNKIARIN